MIIVLYENEDWLVPLVASLKRKKLPYQTRFINGGQIDISSVPEKAVYINRMSPSSHTRGHMDGVRFMREYLSVLESHGMPIINGSTSFSFELSKVQQHAVLEAFGIQTPRTIATIGMKPFGEAGKKMEPPFITKHNQGGKGLGVQLFKSQEGFLNVLAENKYENSPDGVNLIQQYIKSEKEQITRVEIVNGEFLYAINSSTADGFELCPADSCSIDDAFCPVGEEANTGKFQLATEINSETEIVKQYIAFCKQNKIDVAGIEFVEDETGQRYTYDINCTTNYNSNIENQLGFSGMDRIVELAKQRWNAFSNNPNHI
jgi:hypothetical protein